VGDVKTSASTSGPGPGWVVREGATLNRATHARLFAEIGTTFGAGDGSTTFGVGDMRGRVGVHPDGAAGRLSANDALGDAGGTETHTLIASQIPSHGHGAGTFQMPSHVHALGGSNRFVIVSADAGTDQAASGSSFNVPWSSAGTFDDALSSGSVPPTAITGTSGPTGGSDDHPNTQPYLVNGKEHIYAGALGSV
jgi:microcystin-dependent protein